MSSTLSIAVAQSQVTPDIAVNGAHIRELIARAAAQGAGLVLLPEGALSGYAKAQVRSWSGFDWAGLRAELELTAQHCAALGISAAIGSAHPLGPDERPHNSVYIVGPDGAPETRYDKRLLSNTEIRDWYTPGFEAVTIERQGFVFGLSICIEMQFPELFADYERVGSDAVLHATYGLGLAGETVLRAHAATNCLWIAVASPANAVAEGASGIIGPDGNWLARCGDGVDIAIAALDRDDPRLDIALNKARPWRRVARAGGIYAERRSRSPRSTERKTF